MSPRHGLAALAAATNETARAVLAQGGGWGAQKAFISEIYDALPARVKPRTLGDYKKALLELLRRGDVVLSRADLVAAMDAGKVTASEIKHPLGIGEFHFVKVEPASQPLPRPKRKAKARAKAKPIPIDGQGQTRHRAERVGRGARRVGITLSDQEYAELERAAARAGVSLAALCRARVLTE